MMLSVRDVNVEVFHAFKVRAIEKKLRLGKAVTLALKRWLDEEEQKISFIDLKPRDWGKCTENVSKTIDRALYS